MIDTPVDANRARAQLIASIIVPRIFDARLVDWEGYTAAEPLEGVLETHDTIRYSRPARPGATLRMGFLRMLDIHEESRQVTRTGTQTQHERRTVKFDHPIEYETSITHTWGRSSTTGAVRLRTWKEAAKSAWEASAKASIGVAYGGITGAIEVAGKYGEELAREAGGSDTESTSDTETESKTESERLKFTGPIEFTYDAVREIVSETALIRARCDFDCKLYFMDASARDARGHVGGVWEWFSFRGVFIPACKGLAPENPEGSIFASSSPSTHEMFRRWPVSEAAIAALEAPADKVVEFPVPMTGWRTAR